MNKKIDYITFIRKNKFFFITGIFALMAYVTQLILSGWISLILALAQGIFVSLILTLLLRLLFRKKYHFRLGLIRFFLIFSSIIGFFSFLAWTAVFFYNTFPGALSKVTLSDGENTIIFYQMSHIATERYYNSIRNDLKNYAKDGYSFYLEGVLPGSKESQDKLEQVLGMKISGGTYEDIAGVFGLSSQDESLYSEIPKNLLVHADISVDEIALYLSGGSIRTLEPVDLSLEVEKLSQSSLNHRALSYMFRGLLNAFIRYNVSGETLFEMLGPEASEALINKRNNKVVDTYTTNKTKKAIFLYGALHFQGIYDILKSKDSRWEIQSLDPIYPFVP